MKDTVTGDYLVTADIVPGSITGETQSIVAASLTASAASTPVSGLTVVKGAEKVDGVGVVLRAGDGSAIKVTQVQARVYVDTNLTETTEGTFAVADEDTTPKGEITVVYLYDEGGTLLSTKTLTNTSGSPDYGLATFSGLNINIAAGSTEKLIVKYDVSSESGVRDVAVGVPASGITAYDDDDSSVDASGDVNLVTDGATPNYTHISASGTLTVTQDASTPDSDIVLAGTDNVVFSKIKFTAQDEQWTVKELRVDLATPGNESSIENVKITYGTTTQTASLAGGYADFSGMNWVIPQDGEKILTISADLAEINSSVATTGRSLTLGISSTADTFKADGESGTQDTTAAGSDVNGNAMYVRKTRPTVATAALPTSNLLDGTKVINKFTVSADAAGEVDLKKLSWDIIVNDNDDAGLSATNWSLYKNGSGTKIAGLWSNASSTSTTGAIAFTDGSGVLMFEPTNEIAIGAGNMATFELKALVAGSAQYDSISSSLLNDDNDTAVRTGGLADETTGE
jgi:hypothetical protein